MAKHSEEDECLMCEYGSEGQLYACQLNNHPTVGQQIGMAVFLVLLVAIFWWSL